MWGQLFFDLIYVGVAFKLGEVLKAGLKIEIVNGKQKPVNFLGNFGIFIAMYIALEAMWAIKLGFDSRFVADDIGLFVVVSTIPSLRACLTNTRHYYYFLVLHSSSHSRKHARNVGSDLRVGHCQCGRI